MTNKLVEWDTSYKNKDNFLFYPNDEVVRFVSRYIVKRTGLQEFETKHGLDHNPTVLDFGCGIGRHLKMLFEMRVDAYGIDLSEHAVSIARELIGNSDWKDKITSGDCSQMPYKSQMFDFALSHGVLDSMSFELAKKVMSEVHRCLKKGGVLYIDLISGDDSSHFPQYCGEEVVSTKHEEGTIQTFYNWSLINDLIDNNFAFLEAKLVKNISQISKQTTSRYHIILKSL